MDLRYSGISLKGLRTLRKILNQAKRVCVNNGICLKLLRTLREILNQDKWIYDIPALA
jgi:hypothetical protein